MQQHQQGGNDKHEAKPAGENLQKGGNMHPAHKKHEEAYDIQKEKWQRGISAGDHEEINAGEEAATTGTPLKTDGGSSIPLNEDKTTDNP